MVLEEVVGHHRLFGQLARAGKLLSDGLLSFLQGRSFWKRSNLPFLHIMATCNSDSLAK